MPCVNERDGKNLVFSIILMNTKTTSNWLVGWLVGWLVAFYIISTLVGYITSNPVNIYIYIYIYIYIALLSIEHFLYL